MSEILTKQVALSSGCQGQITIASTVFYGHATDMNVHPTFGSFGIAPKIVTHLQHDLKSKRCYAASPASPPCLVRADEAARLRRPAAPSADICLFAETFSVKQNSLGVGAG